MTAFVLFKRAKVFCVFCCIEQRHSRKYAANSFRSVSGALQTKISRREFFYRSQSNIPTFLIHSTSFFGPTNRVVTLKLIRYSLVMLLLPLSTFYFLFYFVFEKDNNMLGWCGIAAVIAANLVIASYVMMAWAEDKQDFAHKRINVKEKARVD